MNRYGIPLAAAATLLAACATAPRQAEDVIYPVDESVPTEDCVNINRIARTEIIDARNILFHMRGGDIYRNVLPRRCPGLDDGDPISYQPRTGQLCDIDTITVLTQTGVGFMQGPSCRLGKYYLINEAEAEAIREESERAEELDLED